MILDLAFISKGFYTPNQVRFTPTYLLGLEAISLHIRDLYYLVNVLTSTESIHWDYSYNDLVI